MSNLMIYWPALPFTSYDSYVDSFPVFILELLGLKPKFSDSLSNMAEKYNRLASVHAPAMHVHEPSLLKLLAMSPKSSVAIVTCLPVVYYVYL